MTHHFNGGILNIESRGIAIPAAVLAIAAIASRLLGVLRDWLLAERFGAGADLDIYFAAFRVPDFIYNILVFGGITVAFLPLFSEYYAKNKQEAWRFANNTLNVFFFFLSVLCILLFIFTPQLVAMIAPGFSADQLAKTAHLSRLMFLSPIIFGVSSIFSGILQYFRRFLAYSLAALLYNAGIIAGIIFLAPAMGITGVGIGVILGALLYLLIQVAPAVQCGFAYRPVFDLKARSLYRVYGLMLPRTAGIAANQLNLIAPTIIASSLATGSITIFNLANNIYSLPVGIIGVSYATAAFAAFSQLYSENRVAELAAKFSETYRQIGYLTIPAAVLLFILSRPVVEVLYFHGQFSQEAAGLAAATLKVFCLGIYFAAVMPAIFRLFFSLRDTATPTLTTVFSVLVNVVLNYVFVAMLAEGELASWARRIFALGGAVDIGVMGLALAFGVANALQFAMLALFLYRKDPALVRLKEIASSFLIAAGAGILMALAVYLVSGLTGRGGFVWQVAGIIASSAVGGIVYLSATLLMGSPEAIGLKQTLLRRFK